MHDHCVGMNLSVFTIMLQGLRSYTYDVDNTHLENGAANFTLSLNTTDPLLDICTLRGVVFGGNDVGNSIAADIKLPDGKHNNIIVVVGSCSMNIHGIMECSYTFYFVFTDCHSVISKSRSCCTVFSAIRPTLSVVSLPTPDPSSPAHTVKPSQTQFTTFVLGTLNISMNTCVTANFISIVGTKLGIIKLYIPVSIVLVYSEPGVFFWIKHAKL